MYSDLRLACPDAVLVELLLAAVKKIIAGKRLIVERSGAETAQNIAVS